MSETGEAALSVLPTQPACASDAGSWCSRIYGWTGNDFLARFGDAIINAVLSILLIVVVAVIVRLVLHRAIDRVTNRAAEGRVPQVLESRWGRRLRQRTPRQLREAASPLLTERRAQRARSLGSLLRSISSAVILVIVILMVLAQFNVNLAPILASAGIVGIAIGFGAQNLVKDFLSGIFMLLEDQYGVGDTIDLGLASGTVEAVGLRVTTLRDVHGTVWHVRNGEVVRVGNKSQLYAVAVIDVPLAHNADTALATRIAERVAAETVATPALAADVLEPPEVLGIEAVSNEGVMLRLIVKTRPGRQFAVQRALNAAIAAAFEDADLPRPAGAP